MVATGPSSTRLVLASAVYVFFTNILPGITFASDLYALTGRSWGTAEVVFSTGICGPVFSLLSAQPLTIMGVTGPFSVLAENLYELSVHPSFQVPFFLPLMAWSLIHAGWMHVLLAVFNAHDWTMQYVTQFSCDVFSLLNSVIYFQKAYKQLSRIHAAVPFTGFLYSVLGALGTCLTAVFLATANSWAPLFGRAGRVGLAEYAAALSIMLWIAVPYMGGELGSLEHHRLPGQSTSFCPTNPDRDYFFVEFWELPIQWVAVAVIPGAITTVLYCFDHEISFIICNHAVLRRQEARRLRLGRRPAGPHHGRLRHHGHPARQRPLPQAPLHSESLRYLAEEKYDDESEDDNNLAIATADRLRRPNLVLAASSSRAQPRRLLPHSAQEDEDPPSPPRARAALLPLPPSIPDPLLRVPAAPVPARPDARLGAGGPLPLNGLRVAIRQPDPAAPVVPPLARVGAGPRQDAPPGRQLDRRARLHADAGGRDAAHFRRDADRGGAEFSADYHRVCARAIGLVRPLLEPRDAALCRCLGVSRGRA
ncbi:hypothetical protein MAPG_02460 [Magnaporthiopsis poae ATCC 64411]|uniref:Bicarbonate transporter-like transmembrane domain-containing protein n=1 Tax=Magnaporthiopsis poae (strain ATCC 64411 / 73-15) TaxID=644358 RepID=A0A0C4DRF3_MAGP6|nr:hypothetical protein MAPG_02460 [Magnaporthiopsis poae ATCC 64411]